jgi:hypothetical protein
MSAKAKNNIPKVKLSAATIAAEELAMKEAKAAKKAKALLIPKGSSSRKYSAKVEAAIAAHESKPKRKFTKWTPKREAEEDLKIHTSSLAAYKADRTKGGNLNAYFINLYTGFIKSLTAEISKLA